MIELHQNQLVFRFPQVHPEAEARVEFQRTLRIPDDDQEYPLPPGFGTFFARSCRRLRSGAGALEEPWRRDYADVAGRGAWINFHSDYPMAVKVAAGKINAVTGEAWTNELSNAPQDYVVTPGQRWLDGFCVGEGLIRQFVAMPLGQGMTAEEQIAGEAEHGGLQIIVYPMRASAYEEMKCRRYAERDNNYLETRVMEDARLYGDLEFGMAPGGLMQQEIYGDRHGIDAWEQNAFSRCFVHLTNAEQYQSVTGMLPPGKPPKPQDYTAAGLPWFDYYQSDLSALGGPEILPKLDSVATALRKKGQQLPDNEPVVVGQTIQLGEARKQVRDDW